MDEAMKENVRSEKQWLRGLFMLLFLVIYEVAEMLLIVMSLLQFIFAIVTGSGNKNLIHFGGSLGQYAKQIIAFLTYNSDEKPFPFGQWPENDAVAITPAVADIERDKAPPTTGS